MKKWNKSLIATAKNAGVNKKFAIFHNAGYRGLYEMGLAELKETKGLSNKEDLLDHVGPTELAANGFRITQTDDKLKREEIKGEQNAIDTHRKVGQEVRNTIKKLGGTMPEKLKPEPSITTLAKKLEKEEEALSEGRPD